MELSLDSSILQNLVTTLEDARGEYTEAASLMREAGDDDLAERFGDLARQRAEFAEQLVEFAAARGVEIEVQRSVAGNLHEVWMELKSALTDSDRDAIVETMRDAEDHATMEYRNALDTDMSEDLEALIRRQHDAIHSAYHEMKSMSGG